MAISTLVLDSQAVWGVLGALWRRGRETAKGSMEWGGGFLFLDTSMVPLLGG